MTVLPGVSGYLVGERVLATAAATIAASDIDRIRRHWLDRRTAMPAVGPASSARQLFEAIATPLAVALGFDIIDVSNASGGAIAATMRANGRSVALLVTPWREALDRRWRQGVTEAVLRSARWCVQTNGAHARIVDADRLYARRCLEFDLDVAGDCAETFAALYRTAGSSALAADDSDVCSLRALVADSDRHAASVSRALRAGVLTASAELAGALVQTRNHQHSLQEGFEQALTIVYRVLFLLFAEARGLVPIWHPVYRESYSIESLREVAERPGEDAVGFWDGLRAIARLAHAGCRAGDLRVTPFNGRLFAPGRTPLAERRDLDDRAARRAMLALSTRTAPDRAGRERIAYRDLGVEQLGAVYETLLDYQPRTRAGGLTLETGSGIRKATGTFYTPQPIAEYLVRRTLAPLVQGASPDDILRLRVVDPAMGSGAFLVCACRYLAAEYERALVEAGRCHAGDITEADRTSMRRTIAERCLYGVDLNPMAVQLARLSLWLATLAADRPLTFLDHRLVAGDSLVGAWLANLRRPPIARPRRPPAALPLFSDDRAADLLRGALPIRFSLEAIPNDTLDQVREKERALAALTAGDAALARWKRTADLWCATWFGARGTSDNIPPAAFEAAADFALTGRSMLPSRTAAAYLATADAIARVRRFVHWELEFPEVFFDGDGRRLSRAGFDAVLGNPPWDMMRDDAGGSAARASAHEEVRFARQSGTFASQSDGHANRYQLFVERAIALTRPGGRIGLVLPAGLAADHGSGRLRRRLFETCDVDAIVGVDNRRGIFPIHRSVRFLLVTAAAGAPTTRTAYRLGVENPAELESVGDEPASASPFFPIHLSPGTLERLSGAGLAIPDVRSSTDLAICEKAAALFPALGADAGWRARFGRELNATDDRAVFHESGRGLPVLDGKHLMPFRVGAADASRRIDIADARRLLGPGRWDRARLAYRDIASATNRVTLIAAMLPAGCVSTHTVFCLRTPLAPRAQFFLCGLFNSLVVNYLVRLRVTSHVTTAMVERLPVPPPDVAPGAFREVASLARLLSRRSENLEAFARLNACVADLYQLTDVEFTHVLSTFPLIPKEHRHAAFMARRTKPQGHKGTESTW